MKTTAKPPKQKVGLRCPRCDCPDLRAYYTRDRDDYILRKRICDQCGQDVITRERIVR